MAYRAGRPGFLAKGLCVFGALLLALLPTLLVSHRAFAASSLSVIDDAQVAITLKAPARRIIPLYAGLAETLTAMGLGKRIVARTSADDALPAELPVIGTHMRPNVELIAALSPDLVVQFEGRHEAGLAAEALLRHGIPVARFRIATFEDLFSCIERLGVLTDERDAASALVASCRERLEALRRMTPQAEEPPQVFFEVRYPNLLGAGGGNMVSDVIRAAGGRNCLAGHAERMVRLNEEALLAADPDIYLMQQGPMNKTPTPLESRPAYRELKALATGFVRIVPEGVYSRPGPGSIRAAEELAALLQEWRSARNNTNRQ